MALKFTRADEPVSIPELTVMIYGAPGIGKSTYAFTALNPVMLDFDNGSYRAMNRKDVLSPETWADVMNIDYAKQFADYDSVIIDTAGRALDLIEQHLIYSSGESQLRQGMSLSLRGYGELRNTFIRWLKLLRGKTNRTIILTAHAKEEQRNDMTYVRIDATGSAKEELYKTADMMGQIFMQDRQRVISFDPADTAFGKNPGGLQAKPIASPAEDATALADAIAETRKAMADRAQGDKQASEETRKLVEFCDAAVEDNQPAEWWTEQVMQDRPRKDKAIIHKAAKKLHLKFDKESGAYVAV